MKLSLNDPLIRQYIRTPLIILLSVVVSLGSLNYLLDLYNENLTQSSQVTERNLNNILRQVRFLRLQEQLFLSYGAKYQSFLREGLVYQQDRVKWTDELLKIQKKLHLVPFTFQFEAEQPLTNDLVGRIQVDKNIFYFTRLNLRMGLVSDLDIEAVFESIRSNITPLFLVNNCEISARMEALKKPKFDPTSALFEANCTLILFQAKPNPFKIG